MSRIGKKPIEIADKVEVKINGTAVSIKGPKGQLNCDLTKGVSVEKVEKTLVIKVDPKLENAKALWGLSRTLISNMIKGVSEGYTKSLIFTGVGYKVQVSGSNVTLNLGYSHPIEYKLPTGIAAAVKGNQIDITGCNKELIGMVAAKIRNMRPPEPYKGKGLQYTDEKIIRKAGKSGAKK